MSHSIQTVVIGGSAGSFAALKTILAQIPGDLPASVFVCRHMGSGAEPQAVDLLRRHSRLPLRMAEDGMAIEPGHVYFAAPDMHMMLGRGHIHLRRGAHENNFRPAIDPLFRSAAIYAAPGALAVVLSGLLDDGAAGARAVERTGGRVIVQDPRSADFPDMPEAALKATERAEAVPLEEIAGRIAALAGQTCMPPKGIPMDIGVEVKIAGLEGASMETVETLGELSPYNCPDCNGVLWQIEDGPLTRFRCHTGHAYSMAALARGQEEALDRGLFETLRAHRGRAGLLRQMMETAGGGHAGEALARRVTLIEEDASRIEEIIRSRRAG